MYKVAQKIGTPFCTPYNFIKYWPIFKLFSQPESRGNLHNTITIDPTTPQMCRSLYLVNCQRLKANIEN